MTEKALDFQTLPETVFSESTALAVKEYFSNIVSNVDTFVEHFRSIPDNMIYDGSYMEKFVINKGY